MRLAIPATGGKNYLHASRNLFSWLWLISFSCVVVVAAAASADSSEVGTTNECGNNQGIETTTAPAAPDVAAAARTIRLYNGVEMPLFQLGTAHLISSGMNDEHAPPGFQGLQPERTYHQMELALQAGIRAFDTALIYRSHKPIAHVLGEWWRTTTTTTTADETKQQQRPRQRHDIWITSKIFHPRISLPFAMTQMPTKLKQMTPQQVQATVQQQFEQSLMELNIGYVDLMLLHWPGDWPEEDDDDANGGGSSSNNRASRLAAWSVLENMYALGLCRAIGVSNFDIKHLEQLKKDGAAIVPMVNQIEASVEVQQTKLRQYCQNNGIAVQAYSALKGILMGDEGSSSSDGGDTSQTLAVLKELAAKYGKDVGQVAFRYLYQLGYAIVYLTNSQQRMISNTQIWDFELTDPEDMQKIHALNSEQGGWGLPRPHEID